VRWHLGGRLTLVKRGGRIHVKGAYMADAAGASRHPRHRRRAAPHHHSPHSPLSGSTAPFDSSVKFTVDLDTSPLRKGSALLPRAAGWAGGRRTQTTATMARGSPAPAAASAASAAAPAATATAAGAGVAGGPAVGAAAPRYPSVSAATVLKLLFFSAAMIFLPIASYFGSRDYLWDGTARPVTAAGTAAAPAHARPRWPATPCSPHRRPVPERGHGRGGRPHRHVQLRGRGVL